MNKRRVAWLVAAVLLLGAGCVVGVWLTRPSEGRVFFDRIALDAADADALAPANADRLKSIGPVVSLDWAGRMDGEPCQVHVHGDNPLKNRALAKSRLAQVETGRLEATFEPPGVVVLTDRGTGEAVFSVRQWIFDRDLVVVVVDRDGWVAEKGYAQHRGRSWWEAAREALGAAWPF
jgi:hypothetical protein